MISKKLPKSKIDQCTQCIDDGDNSRKLVKYVDAEDIYFCFKCWKEYEEAAGGTAPKWLALVATEDQDE